MGQQRQIANVRLGYDWKDKIMSNIDWEVIAENLLEQEKMLSVYNFPKPISVLVTWKNGVYIGSIQIVAPRFSEEIVVLSKSTDKLPEDLVNAIRKLDDKRVELVADDSLDLCGRQHILRRLEDKLVQMTFEQTRYMTEHLPKVVEI